MATLKRRFDPVAGNSHRGRRASLRKRYDAEGEFPCSYHPRVDAS